ncbi:sodium/glutamate symport carrier protein [Calothrix sp. NIES-4101]|nr:sodium/glutamate symport carrier protein [Calothrix sp. NIES-4101]
MNGIFAPAIVDVWKQSPSIFINVVFATIFIGQTIPNLKMIWRKVAPQAAFGQILGWGQYVVGLILAMTVLVPVFNLPVISGCLIEVAFEGGHGTAAGMAKTFEKLGFPAGADLSLALATVGLISGVVAGTVIINWGYRTGKLQIIKASAHSETTEKTSTAEPQEIQIARRNLFRDLLIDPLSFNFGFVGLAIAFGWLILEALRTLEAVTWGASGLKLMPYVPLFPMALIGGAIVQIIVERTGRRYLISRALIENIGGVALDVTIITALATISLAVIGNNLVPFLLLSCAGIVWNICAFLFLAPRIFPTFWLERGIGDMGQSMGVTATGILLMRMADPDNHSGAFEGFAYKQLFFEPILGGGLFTAAAPPLIVEFGAFPILLLSFVIMIFWLIFGLINCKRIQLAAKSA